MPGKLAYFTIILVPGLVFNLAVWGIWWRTLLPRARAIFSTILVITAYWGALDLVAIRLLGIWTFRPEHTTGLMALSLPLEEWTLFVVSGGFIVPLIFVFADRQRAAKAGI